jgi:6-pyruvoyltetrahydropterin/6-carboxytetrahydropterin synthase
MGFKSTKIIDGFSCCFRQEKSAPIHCSKIHGYSIKFEVIFKGDLDTKNWVVDFGFMKRSKHKIKWEDNNGLQEFTPDEWFKYMFDHSIVVAKDDTQLEWFKQGDTNGILQLRIVDNVGCERFAEMVYNVLNRFIIQETDGRVKVYSVRCYEHEKNSAIFEEE